MKLFLFTVLLVFSFPTYSAPLTWSVDGETAYRALDYRAWYSRSRFQKDEWGNPIVFNVTTQLVALKNSSRVKNAFSALNVRRVKGKSPSDRTVKVSTVGTESCQCVAFVKEMTGTNGIGTDSWGEGVSLRNMNLTNLPIGTAIATFNASGVYNHAHTAIVVGKSGNGDWIQVIDQNWSPVVDTSFSTRETSPLNFGGGTENCEWNPNIQEKGFVMTHRIYFDDLQGYTKNANNYSIIDM